jgi:subtilisin family serine protease
MRELLLSTFADQPDIQIVGEVGEDSQIPTTVEQTLPDFVIIAQDNPSKRPAICDALLRLYPQMGIIAVAPDNNFGAYYWATLNVPNSRVDIHSSRFETSEESILETVRFGVQQHGGPIQ